MILAGPHNRTFLTDPWFSTRPGYYQGEPIAAGIGDLPALDGVRLGHISLALLPVNGWQIRPADNMQVVMNATEAAQLTAILNPELAIPTTTPSPAAGSATGSSPTAAPTPAASATPPTSSRPPPRSRSPTPLRAGSTSTRSTKTSTPSRRTCETATSRTSSRPCPRSPATASATRWCNWTSWTSRPASHHATGRWRHVIDAPAPTHCSLADCGLDLIGKCTKLLP